MYVGFYAEVIIANLVFKARPFLLQNIRLETAKMNHDSFFHFCTAEIDLEDQRLTSAVVDFIITCSLLELFVQKRISCMGACSRFFSFFLLVRNC